MGYLLLGAGVLRAWRLVGIKPGLVPCRVGITTRPLGELTGNTGFGVDLLTIEDSLLHIQCGAQLVRKKLRFGVVRDARTQRCEAYLNYWYIHGGSSC